jgi:tRNA-dihydrouridine synthase 3
VRFGKEVKRGGEEGDVVGRGLDLNTQCVVYEELGYCPFGWRCRFLGGHIAKVDDGILGKVVDAVKGEGERFEGWESRGHNRVEADELGKDGWKMKERNWAKADVLAKLKQSEVSSNHKCQSIHAKYGLRKQG